KNKILPVRKNVASSKVLNLLNILSTFILVMLAWIFFRVKTISDGVYYLKSLFTGIWKEVSKAIAIHKIDFGVIGFNKIQIALSFGLIIFLELIHTLQGQKSLRNTLATKPIYLRWATYYSLVLAIIFLGVFEKREFIYFQF
ncbi:MAG: hypothetical protein NTZ59_13055, partial [Bacteroidetes bacterium]|nr:hypothetical protein [Bacteroidota bacterium]